MDDSISCSICRIRPGTFDYASGKLCVHCRNEKNHKRKVYDHLVGLGLGKREDETREQWYERMRYEFFILSKKFKAKQQAMKSE